MASVIEYLVAEISELAGEAATENNKKRITPRHILLAIEQDEELRAVFKPKGTVITGAGVVPFIHENLLKIKTGPKKKKTSIIAETAAKTDAATDEAMEE